MADGEAATEVASRSPTGLSESWSSEALDVSQAPGPSALLPSPEIGAPRLDLIFPVAGEHTLTDSFGDSRGRGNRRHEGIDILAEKGTPVVAVADGVVRWVQRDPAGHCCAVALRHGGGWRTRYLHLDNDTPGTDDGRRVGIAAGVAPGTRVRQGQLLGWVGDSGNAETTVPHLHFELRLADGTPLDPHRRLRTASHLDPPNDLSARR